MENALVSIIIPVYNVSPYLDKCIESACVQTYRNIEILLIDDGSQDDCSEKCDEWEKRDSRIRVVHKKNGGLSDARNAGLEIATGEYIYFLDGDDSLAPELIATVVKHLRDGADMVVFCYNKVYPDDRSIATQYYSLGSFILNDTKSRLDFILSHILQGKLGWEAWSRIYRRDIIESNNLRFVDNRIIFAEDLCFTLCYCTHVSKIVSIGNCLYNYYQRPNSIMSIDSHKVNIGRMNELSKAVLRYFETHEKCKDYVEVFPVIHCLILNNAIQATLRAGRQIDELSALARESVRDKKFYTEHIKALPKNKERLVSILGYRKANEMLNLYKYMLDGFYLGFVIRKKYISFLFLLLYGIKRLVRDDISA